MAIDTLEAKEAFKLRLFWRLLWDRNFLDWRIRKVEQISPINTTAYKSHVSYQFKIPAKFIRDSLQGMPAGLPLEYAGIHVRTEGSNVEDVLGSEQLLIAAEVECLIPVAFLRKRSLVSFSIWGPDGKEALLPSRRRLSEVSKRVVEAALRELDAPGVHDSAPLIIEAQSNAAGDELRRLIRTYGGLSRGCELRERFDLFARRILSGELSRLGLTSEDIGGHWAQESEVFHRQVNGLCAILQGRQHPALPSVWLSPVINPLMLLPEYVRMKLREDPDYLTASPERKRDGKKAAFGLFLKDAMAYLGAVGKVGEKELLRIYPLLEFFALYYIVSVQTRIASGEEFMVKFEQLLPTPTAERGRTFLKDIIDGFRLSGTQEYAVVLADTQSTHVEVSHQAVDLLQDSSQAKVAFGGVTLDVGDVFGSVGHASPVIHHYYSSASAEELASIASSHAGGEDLRVSHPGRLEAVLRIMYVAEPTYQLLMVTTILLTFFLGTVYWKTFSAEEVMKSGQPWNLTLAPVILSVIGFLARGRSNEPLIGQWSRIISVVILLGVLFTLLVVALRIYFYLFF